MKNSIRKTFGKKNEPWLRDSSPLLHSQPRFRRVSRVLRDGEEGEKREEREKGEKGEEVSGAQTSMETSPRSNLIVIRFTTAASDRLVTFTHSTRRSKKRSRKDYSSSSSSDTEDSEDVHRRKAAKMVRRGVGED